MSIWQNPDQERTNQDAQINHKTTLSYYNYAYCFASHFCCVKHMKAWPK